jgi:hypothetical protein
MNYLSTAKLSGRERLMKVFGCINVKRNRRNYMRFLVLFFIITVLTIFSFSSILYGRADSLKANEREQETLYPVQVDGKCGYINRTGKIVIKPQFDEARGFFEGLAFVFFILSCLILYMKQSRKALTERNSSIKIC